MENANFYENEKSVALLQKLGEILKSFLQSLTYGQGRQGWNF